MVEGAVGVLDRARPLERQLFVRPRPGPDGYGELDGLEVEVVARVRQVAKQIGGARIGERDAGDRGRPDAMRQAIADRIRGHVAQIAVTLLGQLIAKTPMRAEDVERIRGTVAIAPRMKRARVG